MTKIRRLPAFAILFLIGAAAAHGATLRITIQAPLVIVFTPANPTIECEVPGGTVVSAISVTGGNGNPVTYSLTGGDIAHFAISGSNIVVGTGGIPPSNCGVVKTIVVTATQN